MLIRFIVIVTGGEGWRLQIRLPLKRNRFLRKPFVVMVSLPKAACLWTWRSNVNGKVKSGSLQDDVRVAAIFSLMPQRPATNCLGRRQGRSLTIRPKLTIDN
jgi:hypothetical protein